MIVIYFVTCLFMSFVHLLNWVVYYQSILSSRLSLIWFAGISSHSWLSILLILQYFEPKDRLDEFLVYSIYFKLYKVIDTQIQEWVAKSGSWRLLCFLKCFSSFSSYIYRPWVIICIYNRKGSNHVYLHVDISLSPHHLLKRLLSWSSYWDVSATLRISWPEMYRFVLNHQSYLTSLQPMDCSPQGLLSHMILQARILVWGHSLHPPWIFSKPRIEPHLLCLLHSRWVLH